MPSRSLASGAMLVVLLGAVGGALWQQGVEAPEASVADVEIAEDAAPAANPDEPALTEIASQEIAPGDGDDVRSVGPIVTVNGRPLGSPQAPAAQPAGPVAAPQADEREAGGEEEQVEIAVVPPMPPARPEGLVTRPAPDVVDYNAIAEAAYGTRGDDVMSIEERRALGPLPGAPIPQEPIPQAPEQHLVRIIGPDGQAIWVYPDQIERPESRVVIERWQAPNPFGFLYE